MSSIKIPTLQELVVEWGNDKGITEPENVNRQFLKLIEEVGELAGGIARGNRAKIADAIGDVQVVLIILSEQLGEDYDKCLRDVYDIISKRKGKTVDGVFIKEGD